MSKSSFNFTEAIKTLIEKEEIEINCLVDTFLQNVIKAVSEADIMLSKEIISEIFFIQTDSSFEDYYENYSIGESYETVSDEYDDPCGDTIYVAFKRIYASEDYELPFIQIYAEEFDSSMEASIMLNEIRKKLMNEELSTREYYCIGSVINGRSFAVKFED